MDIEGINRKIIEDSLAAEEKANLLKKVNTLSTSVKQDEQLSLLDTKLPVGLTVSDGKLQVQLPPGSIGLTDTELRASDLNVTISNPTTNPEVGLTKEATQLLVLDRLNSLKTYTDGIETLLTAINSDTTTENINLASVIAALDLIKGYVDNLESYTDGLEGTATTLNSLVITLNTYVDGLEGLLSTLNGKDYATQTTLATVLSTLTAISTKLADTLAVTQAGSWAVTILNPTANTETGLAKDATFVKDVDGGIKTHVQNFPAQTGLTDDQLRATPIPVSGTMTTTPTDVSALSKEVTQLLVKEKTDNLDVALSTRLKPSDTLSKVTTVDTITNTVTIKADTLLNQTNALKVDGSSVTQPVSNVSLPLPIGASTEATLIQVRDYLDTVEIKLASLITSTTGLTLENTQVQIRDYLDTVETRLASLITNTTGLGTEATLILSKTALDNIYTKLQAAISVTQSGAWSVTVLNPTTNPETGLNKDATQLLVNANQTNGNQKTQIPAVAVSKKSVIITTLGDTTIHTPAIGKKIRLYGFGYSAKGTVLGVGEVLTRWKFGTGNYLDNQYLTGNQGYGKTPGNGKFCYESNINEALIVNLDVATSVAVNIDYEEI